MSLENVPKPVCVVVKLLLKLEPTEHEKYFRRLDRKMKNKLKDYVFGEVDTKRFEVPQHIYYELMKIAMEFNKQRKIKINKEDENNDKKKTAKNVLSVVCLPAGLHSVPKKIFYIIALTVTAIICVAIVLSC